MTMFFDSPGNAKQTAPVNGRPWMISFVAILLISAAGLKLWSFATTPSSPVSWTDMPFVVLASCGFEILLASWLVAGWQRQIAKLITIIFFSIVSCVAASKWWRGELSCGCFGPLKVSPWITTFLDLGILTGLVWELFAKPERRTSTSALRISVVLTFGVSAGAILPAIAYHSHPVAVNSAGITESNGLIVLEPEKWVGKPFPLTTYITTQHAIAQGACRIVLFHNDCPDCQRLLPKVEEVARTKAVRTVLVEIPPAAPPDRSIVTSNTVCEIGTLDASKEWFSATPVIIDLSNGWVIQQQSGGQAEP